MAFLNPAIVKKNLILVHLPGSFDARDVLEIAQHVVKRAPDIAVHIVASRETHHVIPPEKWSRPTLTVSLCGRVKKFRPVRGPLLHNVAMSKMEQFRLFKSAGVPTPHTRVFNFGDRYHEEEWGEFVVLKPAELDATSFGAGVSLMRTRRLDDFSLNGRGAEASPKFDSALVQQFIDTGKLPTFWRALTLFGHTLYCMRSWSPLGRPELESPDDEIESAIIEPKHPKVVAGYAIREMRALERDDEITDFVRRVHDLVPTLPLLGCDVIREEKTGQLYIVEINAGGNVWHFSSPRSRKGRREITRDDRIRQFGAWDIAARALIDKTRQLAA